MLGEERAVGGWGARSAVKCLNELRLKATGRQRARAWADMWPVHSQRGALHVTRTDATDRLGGAASLGFEI